MNIPDKNYIHSITLSPLTVQLYLELDFPPSDDTNTGYAVHDAFYAIVYPGPVINHLDCHRFIVRIIKRTSQNLTFKHGTCLTTR